jgi:gliding motility-associated lipoprotein GldD
MPRYITAFLLFLIIASCRPTVYPPKPAGYYRIDTPASHQYKLFDRPGFPFTFEYPEYSEIADDTIFQNMKEKNPYWINIIIPSLGGVINVTYKEFSSRKKYDSLVADAYGLSFFHHEKADYIEPIFFSSMSGTSGIIYNLGGNVASKYQFTATDSIRHFMRGALYFDVTPNADSLKPATDFLEKDIEHLLATLKWKTPGPAGMKGSTLDRNLEK